MDSHEYAKARYKMLSKRFNITLIFFIIFVIVMLTWGTVPYNSKDLRDWAVKENHSVSTKLTEFKKSIEELNIEKSKLSVQGKGTEEIETQISALNMEISSLELYQNKLINIEGSVTHNKLGLFCMFGIVICGWHILALALPLCLNSHAADD